MSKEPLTNMMVGNIHPLAKSIVTLMAWFLMVTFVLSNAFALIPLNDGILDYIPEAIGVIVALIIKFWP